MLRNRLRRLSAQDQLTLRSPAIHNFRYDLEKRRVVHTLGLNSFLVDNRARYSPMQHATEAVLVFALGLIHALHGLGW